MRCSLVVVRRGYLCSGLPRVPGCNFKGGPEDLGSDEFRHGWGSMAACRNEGVALRRNGVIIFGCRDRKMWFGGGRRFVSAMVNEDEDSCGGGREPAGWQSRIRSARSCSLDLDD